MNCLQSRALLALASSYLFAALNGIPAPEMEAAMQRRSWTDNRFGR